MKPQLFIIDGIIGAGKSHAIGILQQIYKKREDVFIFSEPIEEYTKITLIKTVYDPLQKLYDGDSGDTVCSQLHFITTLSRLSWTYPDNSYIICERCLPSCEVFINTLRDLHKISQYTKDYLLHTLDSNLNDLHHSVDIVKHYIINTPILTCIKRIKERGRKAEQNTLSKQDWVCYETYLQHNFNKLQNTVTLSQNDMIADICKHI